MDSLFGKLGLFDFFSMLIPGLIIESGAVLLFPGIADTFAQYESVQLFLYLLVGYLIGLVLHEIIGIIPEKFHVSLVQKAHRLSEDGVIFTNINDVNLLQGVKASISHKDGKSENKKENTDRYIVSVCTNDLQAKGKADKAERLQVLSEMSESLSVGFFLLGIIKFFVIVYGVFLNGQPMKTMRSSLIACVVLLLLCVLFVERAQRMHKYYLRCLIRTYAVVNNIAPVSNAAKNNERKKCSKLLQKLNRTSMLNQPRRNRLVKKLFGSIDGAPYHIQSPLYVEYGHNIHAGKNFLSNYNAVLQDEAEIFFGDNVMLASNVILATDPRSLTDEQRESRGLDKYLPTQPPSYIQAKPIRIGNSVWICANVTVLGGVTIGDHAVIGAGSIVTCDIPPNTFACGAPCRVVREITENDRLEENVIRREVMP